MTYSSMLFFAAHTGRSTHVEMQLLLHGESLPVGQVGPNFVLPKTPLDHPPVEGTLLVRVDEKEHRWPVRLPAGSSAADRRVAIEKLKKGISLGRGPRSVGSRNG